MRSVVIKLMPFDEKVAKRSKQNAHAGKVKVTYGSAKGRGGGGERRGEETIIGK